MACISNHKMMTTVAIDNSVRAQPVINALFDQVIWLTKMKLRRIISLFYSSKQKSSVSLLLTNFSRQPNPAPNLNHVFASL